MDYFAELDRLIEGPVYVIDYLPGPVPASRGRHYWKVEKWFSSQREYKRLYRKFLRLLLKLSCYCEFTVSYGPKWEENPSPKRLERLVEKHRQPERLPQYPDRSGTGHGDPQWGRPLSERL